MKQLIAGLLLMGLLSPSLVAAQQIPILYNTGTQPGTFSNILTNDPGSNGLVTDIQQLRLRVNQLFAILNSLYAVMKAREAANATTTPPVVPPAVNDNKVKIELKGLKANYIVGDDITFSLWAKQKEGGPNTITFNSCQVSFTIKNNATGAVVYNSLAAQSCMQMITTTSLPNTWPLSYTDELALGSYKLVAEVTGYGKSDEWNFKVSRPGDATISLTKPNGNEVWATSSQQTIEWSTTNAATTDKIDLILITPGQAYIPLAGGTAGISNDGKETITVPNNLLPGSYTLFARVTSGGRTADTNRVQITIPEPAHSASAPFIKSISPSKALAGATLTISASGLLDKNTVQVGTSTISDVAPSNDKLSVTIPGISPGLATVKVTNTNGVSNSVNLEIERYAPTTPVVTEVTVTAPTANNEEWVTGTNRAITWTSTPATGAAGFVNIRLVNNDTNLISDLKLKVANTGTYTWKVGALENGSTAVAGKYKIRICPIGNGDCSRSDNNVKIVVSGAKTSMSGNSELAATASVLQDLIGQLNNLLRLR